MPLHWYKVDDQAGQVHFNHRHPQAVWVAASYEIIQPSPVPQDSAEPEPNLPVHEGYVRWNPSVLALPSVFSQESVIH